MRILPIIMVSFILVACGGGESQAAEDQQHRIISVSGTGDVAGTPDLAIMQFGVITEGKTAGDAISANSREMNAVRAQLKKIGIADRDLQTSNFSLSPKYPAYNRNSPEERKIIGYTVNNTLTVRLRDVEKVGEAIDKATQAGANSMHSLQFGFQNQGDLQDDAQQAAVRDARATAEMLAKEAGVKLGRVMSISVPNFTRGPQPMARAAMADFESSTPIEAGESVLSATVSMTFEIE